MSSIASKILKELEKSDQVRRRYLKEDFLGVTTLGGLFKDYESTLLAALETAIVREFENLPDTAKEKVSPDKTIILSFSEEEDDRFEITFLLNNIGTDREEKVTLNVTVDGASLVISTLTAGEGFITTAEIDHLSEQYNGITIALTDFAHFIDQVIFYINDLVYLYFHALANSFSSNNKNAYEIKAVKNFLDYLSEELNREILFNSVYDSLCDISIDYDRLTFSLNCYTPDRRDFLLLDYLWSPSARVLQQVNIKASTSLAVSKVKELGPETLIEFMGALKKDLHTIAGEIKEEEISVKKHRESSLLMVLKGVDRETGIITLEINGKSYDYMLNDPAKSMDDAEKEIKDIINSNPGDLLAYIENHLELVVKDYIEKEDESATSFDTASQDKNITTVEDHLQVNKDEIEDSEMRIVFTSNEARDYNRASQLVTEKKAYLAVNYLAGKRKKNEQHKELFTSNYQEDLHIDEGCKIHEAGSYTIVFNEKKKNVTLLQKAGTFFRKQNKEDKMISKQTNQRRRHQNNRDNFRNEGSLTREDYRHEMEKRRHDLRDQRRFSGKGITLNHENLRLKRDVRRYLKDEGYNVHLEDIRQISPLHFDRLMGKDEAEFYEEVKDTDNRKEYRIGIMGDKIYISEKRGGRYEKD